MEDYLAPDDAWPSFENFNLYHWHVSLTFFCSVKDVSVSSCIVWSCVPHEGVLPLKGGRRRRRWTSHTGEGVCYGKVWKTVLYFWPMTLSSKGDFTLKSFTKPLRTNICHCSEIYYSTQLSLKHIYEHIVGLMYASDSQNHHKFVIWTPLSCQIGSAPAA